MLPANIISALQVLSNPGKSPSALASDAPKPITNLEPGQQFQGNVQEKLSEGLFKVQVAGQTIQMRLPGNIKSGDTIRLEVISTRPRITFSMAASTNPLSNPEQIGSAAQLLSNLAERPIERPIVQQLGNKAVWQAEQKTPDTKLLAGALRETLGKSGLFYESHQAQWVRGERSMNQLLEEPQNLLTMKNLTLSAVDHRTAAENIETSRAPGNATSQPIAKELVNLVQQQLHTLEQHHLVWMGQVWPGQQMQWEIQGQPEQHPRQQSERQWSTELELALHRLGDIHARLVFSESGLQLTLNAADSATVALFNRAIPTLKNSLAEAGIPLIATVVEKS